MSSAVPPQRRQPSAQPGQGRGMSPAQGAAAAEQRTGKPCFHAGQIVPGLFRCVACQFQIRNRRALPACPDCGELVWAYMEDGPRPVPEGEAPTAAPAQAPAPAVQEGVRLEATPVKVEENVRLEP